MVDVIGLSGVPSGFDGNPGTLSVFGSEFYDVSCSVAMGRAFF